MLESGQDWDFLGLLSFEIIFKWEWREKKKEYMGTNKREGGEQDQEEAPG